MENPKIKETRKLGENLMVVELENGFSVAYEGKGIGEKICSEYGHKSESQEGEVVYAILRGGHSYSCYQVGTDKCASFSKEAKEKVESYLSSLGSESTTASLESKIPEIYAGVTKPLGIKECRCRDWNEIKFWGKAMLVWPISMYYAFIDRDKRCCNDGLLGAVLAPLFVPHILFNLVWPTKKAKKITNKKAVTKNRQNGDAAIVFCGEYVGEKATLKRFDSLDIIFEDGLFISGRHLFKDDDNKEEYKEAKRFIKLDSNLKKRIYETFKAIELEEERYYSAYLETENADHSSLSAERFKHVSKLEKKVEE